MERTIGPTQDYRVVQIHPLLRCNLRCAHCYSVSGPGQSSELPLPALLRTLDALKQEAFNGVGISGGEPLLYAGLPGLLRHARGLGMVTTVTTNGILLDAERAHLLKEAATLVAVSLDGPPESHNRIRGHPHAFQRMEQGVEHLKAAGVPFGFIFTLTLFNLDEMDWIAGYAIQQGARLLQVHPLEETGRARDALPGAAPDNLELARAYVEIARLHELYGERMKIQFDVADKAVLCSDPERAFAIELCADARKSLESVPLGQLLAPLVIEADGAMVPLQYNFSRLYQIGNILAEPSKIDFGAWKRDVFPRFLQLCRQVHYRLTQCDVSEFPFVNWYSEVLEDSCGSVAQASAPAQLMGEISSRSG